jgi:hypothetical protein
VRRRGIRFARMSSRGSVAGAPPSRVDRGHHGAFGKSLRGGGFGLRRRDVGARRGAQPLEPCRFGIPVVVGTWVGSIKDVVALLSEAGSLDVVADEETLARRLRDVADQPSEVRRPGLPRPREFSNGAAGRQPERRRRSGTCFARPRIHLTWPSAKCSRRNRCRWGTPTRCAIRFPMRSSTRA